MLIIHRETLPSFAVLSEDQAPLAVYTILSINDEVRDCAAYRGIAALIAP